MQDADRKKAAPGESSSTALRGRWLTPPNVVSLLRIAMAPLAGWLIMTGQPVWAFWVFLLAGVSDGIDGGLARWLDMRTDLGSILDPIADKALLVIGFFALGFQGHIPMWLVMLVIVRDLCLVLASALLYFRAQGLRGMRPSWISKVNTALQIILAGSTLAALAFGLTLGVVATALIWATAVTTTVSGLGYLIRLVGSTGTDKEVI